MSRRETEGEPPIVKAIVIDDSAFNRVTLSRLLESGGNVKVIATAVNGEDGIKQVLKETPDVITLDLEMPVMDGFAFLRWLMANRPVPVIAISSRSSDRSVFKALELGAVDFIGKPGGRVSTRLEEVREELLTKVYQVTHAALANVQRQIRDVEITGIPTGKVIPAAERHVDLIVIGSSTGGPPAIQTLFQGLPLLPVPIVIAQHMPPVFTRLFAERVNRLTPYKVQEASDGELLLPGMVYIAPGGMQTEVVREKEQLRLRCRDRRPEEIHAPSVDHLFRSAARTCGERIIGVILTGMGDDGTEGMREIRAQGGRTVAESEETAIIFGMPQEAIKAGVVDHVLPLNRIGRMIPKLAVGRARS